MESIEHVLFRCDLAMSVWDLSSLSHLCSNVVAINIWVENVLIKEGANSFSAVCLGMLVIWNARNHFIFKDISHNASCTVEEALSLAEEILGAFFPHPDSSPRLIGCTS